MFVIFIGHRIPVFVGPGPTNNIKFLDRMNENGSDNLSYTMILEKSLLQETVKLSKFKELIKNERNRCIFSAKPDPGQA